MIRILLVILFFISACAVPPSVDRRFSFISEKEQELVSLIRLGLYQVEKSQFVDAQLTFQKALLIDPESDTVRLNLTSLAIRQGLLEKAKFFLDSPIRKLNRHEDWENLELQYLIAEDSYDLALDKLSLALNKDLDNKQFNKAAKKIELLTSLSYQIGLEDRALCYSELLWKVHPRIEELLRYGRLSLSLGMTKKIEAKLLKLIETQGQKPDLKVIHLLSLFEYELNKLKEAEYYNSIVLENISLIPEADWEAQVLKSILDQEVLYYEPLESIFSKVDLNSRNALYWGKEFTVKTIQAKKRLYF